MEQKYAIIRNLPLSLRKENRILVRIALENLIWERCCTCPDEVEEAACGRAGRVEICDRLDLDGITPSRGDIVSSVGKGILVNVMVRPRGGDFVCSEDEVRGMLDDISICADLGANGVVAGILDGEGNVDVKATARLVARAVGLGLEFTFHRAFDLCPDKASSLESLIDIGCTRVLTSGGAYTAMKGASVISALVRQAGERISVMPGGGVTPDNVAVLKSLTGAREFHGTRLF